MMESVTDGNIEGDDVLPPKVRRVEVEDGLLSSTSTPVDVTSMEKEEIRLVPDLVYPFDSARLVPLPPFVNINSGGLTVEQAQLKVASTPPLHINTQGKLALGFGSGLALNDSGQLVTTSADLIKVKPPLFIDSSEPPTSTILLHNHSSLKVNEGALAINNPAVPLTLTEDGQLALMFDPKRFKVDPSSGALTTVPLVEHFYATCSSTFPGLRNIQAHVQKITLPKRAVQFSRVYSLEFSSFSINFFLSGHPKWTCPEEIYPVFDEMCDGGPHFDLFVNAMKAYNNGGGAQPELSYGLFIRYEKIPRTITFYFTPLLNEVLPGSSNAVIGSVQTSYFLL